RAGTQLVAGLQVLKAGKSTVALHQAEPDRVEGGERSHQQALWIGKRAPDPLAVLKANRKPVRIVHLGPIVVTGPLLAGAEREHAGERCDCQLAYLVAQIESRLDIDRRVDTGLEDEAV